MVSPRHVYLVDGSGFIFRAFHALPSMTRPDGTPVNAVYGFTAMVMKLLEETDADHVAVVFDRARRTFRNEIYPDYKAHRPPPPPELIPQFDLVREAVAALNVAAVEMDGFEADDLIATYTRLALEAGARVTIVSSDKDLMQLVSDRVTMFDAMKTRIIGPDEVREKFGVGPDRVVDVLALAGDSSDNVPGVPGIGVKTAAQLIESHGCLDAVLAQAEGIRQPKRRQALLEHAATARLSRELVRLRHDVPPPAPLSDFAVRPVEPDRLIEFLERQAFRSLVVKVRARAAAVTGAEEGRRERAADEEGPASSSSAAIGASRSHEKAYELVQDVEALRRWLNAAREAGVVTVDTETTDLDSMRARLVGVSLSAEPGRACYIPLGHHASRSQGSFDFDRDSVSSEEGPWQIPLAQALPLLKEIFEDSSILKVGQNIKYDMQILVRHGISVAPVDDTMLMSYVLDGSGHGHGMDELALLHLGHETIKFKDVVGTGKKQITFDLVPLDQALDYAAEDADITGQLHRVLKPRLLARHMIGVYETLERPLIPVLERMERWGIKVDAVELRRLGDDFAIRLTQLEREIHALAGREFNVASPQQLGEVLFRDKGLPGGRKSKTGAYGTGADVLEELALQGHELPARVLDWRQLAKLKSTYADALVRQINPDTGRVHTSYAMSGTSTGRLASSDPNLQNIPIRTEEGRKIRRAFIAEDGFVLVSADYSQIELRLLAHVAGIDSLKDAFRHGLDIHAMTASQVFGVPVEGMDPQVRRRAKAINFGIIYGISAFGLARQLGISRTEAGQYIESYFQRFPGIRAYMDRTVEEARRAGFVSTLFGRKCHVAGLADKNPMRRGNAERAAINAPIQGGAADIIKRAMIRLPSALERAGLGARMLLQVHDELVFEVPRGELDATLPVIRAVMEGAAKLEVPLVVDIGSGANWDDAH